MTFSIEYGPSNYAPNAITTHNKLSFDRCAIVQKDFIGPPVKNNLHHFPASDHRVRYPSPQTSPKVLSANHYLNSSRGFHPRKCPTPRGGKPPLLDTMAGAPDIFDQSPVKMRKHPHAIRCKADAGAYIS
ncbi:hypothetical protein KC330_g4130 [Hortaea werneckii]|nr:hypothetical protein KC330_g4130 [Hortaea werneckii]